MSSKQKVQVQPINVIFRHLQDQAPVSLWLYDNTSTRIEGKIAGFDEFMNVVLTDASEVTVASGERQRLGAFSFPLGLACDWTEPACN